MKNSKLIIVLGMLMMGLMFLGFQCSSTDLTSAKLYIQQKNCDKAIETLNTEVTKNPQSDEGYFLLGTVYSAQHNIDKMMEWCHKSLAISNKFQKNIEEYKAFQWANNFNRGVNLFQRGNKSTDADSSKMYFDMAIDAYNKAIMLEPDSGETYRNLAFVLLTTGKTEESISPLKKLVDLEQAEEGYQYLGEVYYTLGLNKMSDFKMDKNVQDSVKAMEYYNNSIAVLEEGTAKYPGCQGKILPQAEYRVQDKALTVAEILHRSHRPGKNLPAADDNRPAVGVLARELLDELGRPFQLNQQELYVTGSVGIALCPRDADNVVDLIRNADAAMYYSKQNGGNSHSFFTPEMSAAAVERLMMKAKLRRAVEGDELVILYQPKVDLREGRVVGGEALVRWRLPGHGDIAPAQFIPLAEESNLIQEIGEWVLKPRSNQGPPWFWLDPGQVCYSVHRGAAAGCHNAGHLYSQAWFMGGDP